MQEKTKKYATFCQNSPEMGKFVQKKAFAGQSPTPNPHLGGWSRGGQAALPTAPGAHAPSQHHSAGRGASPAQLRTLDSRWEGRREEGELRPDFPNGKKKKHHWDDALNIIPV